MKLSQFQNHLNNVSEINFVQPNSHFVPRHFHITEAGLTTKHFIDCGGVIRTEKTINFQLWVANDFEHRLEPQKLQKIINIAAPLFNDEDLEIEVEYQTETIGRYGLDFDGNNFLLKEKQTDCLAKDHCGIPPEKLKVKLSDLKSKSTCCTPGSGCC
ncbi:MAG: hypothetical protein H6607_08560 [Flavobacteriales bacterium]|nr:hypothetical protein [Flavobacteriales bacterium]